MTENWKNFTNLKVVPLSLWRKINIFTEPVTGSPQEHNHIVSNAYFKHAKP